MAREIPGLFEVRKLVEKMEGYKMAGEKVLRVECLKEE
jgi:hypothetical protein